MDGKNRQCHIRGKMRKKVRDANAHERTRLRCHTSLSRSRLSLATLTRSSLATRHRQVWVAAGDIVLVSLREYQDEKGDVILKYSADEARALKAAGEIPEHITINDAAVEPSGGGDEAGGFEFGDDSDSSSDDGAGGGGGGALDVDAI